jgi:4-hydroxymandelate oxidase
VTLDTPVQVHNFANQRSGFQMKPGAIPVNLKSYPVPEKIELPPGTSRIFQGLMREAPTREDIVWLQSQTKLPIWIKGVLHPEDAKDFRGVGIAGLIVSNHGGRALDGALASLDALPEIRDAVGAAYPLLLDSGIRSGLDIFKALALGADAVSVGRLQLYALSVAGALGVAHMLKLLREELEICMALSSCATLRDIRGASLVRAGGVRD